ncbi:hypothetical protein BH11GEM1_BH11GEM1_21490 [soil metagenome]
MLTYAVDSVRKRIDVQIGGTTSGAEIQAGIRSMLHDPAFDPAYPMLVELHALEQTPTIPELRDIALMVRANASTSARRAIVTEQLLFYGLAVLFAILTEGASTRYHAFRSRDEAEAWLSV